MEESKVAIELLKHQDFHLLQKFIHTSFSKNHIFSKENTIFDWQYKGPSEYFCMSAKKGNELIGIQGFIPLCHFDKNLPSDQIFLALWVAQGGREVGVGLRCHNQLLKIFKPKFLGSLGINKKAIAFHVWQKFNVGIMDHHVALSPRVKNFKIAVVTNDIIPAKTKHRSSISFEKITESKLQTLDTSKLYLHQTPLKSDIYIKNRFMNHPVYSYDVYAITKEEIPQALCVIRPILQDGVSVLRIVDFIGANEVFLLLPEFILAILEEYDAEYIDLYSHGVPLKTLKQSEFINCKKTKGLIIPNYFEPFEQKNVDIAFAYKTTQSLPPVRLFKADGDQDRPKQLK
tara:strand:- start:399 stop:1430 length:1032 start_codon:yes stop_codon:yes gene_type:complete